MTTYRVCIIVPPGYMHSQCFAEVAFLLKHSLVSLGFSCDIAVNDFARDRINIILGWHLLPYCDVISSLRYIPYQLEQLSETAWNAFPEQSKTVLKNAFALWDYSRENIAFLNSCGLHALHVPVGYHEGLELIPQNCEKTIDVLFYGSSCKRRDTVIASLSKNPDVNVQTLFGVYGKKRDEYISRSKIILNIHFYPSKILEAIRVSYLLNNQCFVISEKSEINPYKDIALPMFPYENLADACLVFVKKEYDREQIRTTCYRQFKEKYPMTESLKNAVETMSG
jgi:hypothetical protein